MSDEMINGIVIGIVLTVVVSLLPTLYRILKNFIGGELELREKVVKENLTKWVHDKYLGREEAKAVYVTHTTLQQVLEEELGKALDDHERKWNHSAPYANRVKFTEE